MPEYVYEHDGNGCELGKTFSIEQSIKDEPISVCPACGQEVYRVLRPFYVNSPSSNSDLRDKGFVKLEKRDHGVYENVTATDKESRYFHADKPHTAPDLLKRGMD